MAEVATGILMTPIDRLRRLVAASVTFQELVGVDGEDDPAAEALAYIYLPEAVGSSVPRAIITPEEGWHSQKVGTGTWVSEGAAALTIEAPVASEEAGAIEDEMYWFDNRMGQIVAEMMALAGIGESVTGETHLNVVRITREVLDRVDVAETPHSALGDNSARWFAGFRMEWF